MFRAALCALLATATWLAGCDRTATGGSTIATPGSEAQGRLVSDVSHTRDMQAMNPRDFCGPPLHVSRNLPEIPMSQAHAVCGTYLSRRGRDYPADPLIDPAERDLPIPSSMRIVSAAPSVTEILAALGLRDAIVGRTRYCTHPPGIEEVPSFGALLDISTESLLASKPSLIIISGTSRSIADRLAPLKIPVESVPDDSLEDVFSAIQRIGDLCGRPKTAALLCKNLRDDLDSVVSRFGGGNALRVLVATGPLANPPRAPFVAGPQSFYDELLEMGGHRNALPDEAASFGELSLEMLLSINPNVIVELDPDAATNDPADALARWGTIGPLDAVRNRRLIVLPGPAPFVPGPRIARVYQELLSQLASLAVP
jgi:iron complex transport system substrate-binding protein